MPVFGRIMNRTELEALSRRDLQQEAKRMGIKANQSNSILIQKLLEKYSENEDKSKENVVEEENDEMKTNEIEESIQNKSIPESEDTVIVSESEQNLVDEVSRILDGDTQSSFIRSSSQIHSDIDTLTLQDVLKRDDTTFIAPNESLGNINDVPGSSENTSQSRLPSLSKNIISMLIDIDNENYGKPEEKHDSLEAGSDSNLIPTIPDNRHSHTILSENTIRINEKLRNSEDTLDLAVHQQQSRQSDVITPATCFDQYADNELYRLCSIYKERVQQGNNKEDIDILLNINSVISNRITKKETVTTPYTPNHVLLRDGSLVVAPNTSNVDLDAVKQDTWQVNGMNHSESEEKVNDDDEEEEIVPKRLTFSYSSNDNKSNQDNNSLPAPSSPNQPASPAQPASPIQSTYQPYQPHFRSRDRRTILSVNRLKEIEAGGSLPHPLTADEIEEELSEEESSSLDRETTCNHHTFITVDMDLDNPDVEKDNEEAQNRFYQTLEQSVENIKIASKIPSFLDNFDNEIEEKEKMMRRESLLNEISNSIDKAKKVENCQSSDESQFPLPSNFQIEEDLLHKIDSSKQENHEKRDGSDISLIAPSLKKMK